MGGAEGVFHLAGDTMTPAVRGAEGVFHLAGDTMDSGGEGDDGKAGSDGNGDDDEFQAIMDQWIADGVPRPRHHEGWTSAQAATGVQRLPS